MPHAIHPMLATLVDRPFDDQEWLYEIKWDGYRAVAFLENGAVRLVSRNQNDFTAAYPELQVISEYINAKNAILDGEIVALDNDGRSSFSLMQQRTGVGEGGRRIRRTRDDIPVVYYVFDLLYLDGYNLMETDLEERKQRLSTVLTRSDLVRYSDHYVGSGSALFEAAAQSGLEGIIAKRRGSCYLQKRTREWLKIKIVKRQECGGPGRERLYGRDSRRHVEAIACTGNDAQSIRRQSRERPPPALRQAVFGGRD
jgi:bifunctional non-homologous end joining protein LigD